MRTRIKTSKARELLEQGLSDPGVKADAELTKDLGALAAFFAVALDPSPVTLAMAIGALMQATGGAIAAAQNLAARFARGGAERLEPYERFVALFYLTTLDAYARALSDALARVPLTEGGEDLVSPFALEEVRRLIEEVDEAELTHRFAAEPLRDEAPLLDALHRWLVATLEAGGMPRGEATGFAHGVEEGARARFRVALAAGDPQANWMREYLGLTRDESARSKQESLQAIAAAVEGWLEAQHEGEAARASAWEEYRGVLRGLPDERATMYGERFGVRRVFQAPVADYSIVHEHEARPADDVLGLLASLVSRRTPPGEGLVIVSGGPGSGKSTLCRMFVSELAQIPAVHPVFLRLRRAKDAARVTTFIERELRERGLIGEISDLGRLPNVVIVLDGFDELVSADRGRLVDFFGELADAVATTGPLGRAKLIVSGRDTLFPGGHGLPPASHLLELQPFDDARVQDWGARWRALHRHERGGGFAPERFLRGEGSPLEHLLRWPLTLHLIARLHQSGGLPDPDEDGREIDRAFLYRSILASTAARQEQQATGEPGRLDPGDLRAFLREVAWLMYTRGVDTLDRRDVEPILAPFHTGGSLAGLAELAIMNAPELDKAEDVGFEFVHKSFSEFLVAEHIAAAAEDPAPAALLAVLAPRPLTVEVQDMLEPMLGSFEAFARGTRVDEAPDPAARREGLERVLRRCEALYAEALDIQRPRTASLNELANAVAGYALIGAAAAAQLDDEHRRFDAEPFDGALWRFLALAHGGGVSFEELTGAFGRMTVRAHGGPGVEDESLPWRLRTLAEIDGFTSGVSALVDRARDADTEKRLLLFALAFALLERTEHDGADRWQVNVALEELRMRAEPREFRDLDRALIALNVHRSDIFSSGRSQVEVEEQLRDLLERTLRSVSAAELRRARRAMIDQLRQPGRVGALLEFLDRD